MLDPKSDSSPRLLALVRCPACWAELMPSEGDARCTGCDAVYTWRDGILDLNPRPTEEAAAEMAAHRAMEERWMREVVPAALRPFLEGDRGLENLLAMPHCPHPELVRVVPDIRRVHEMADDFYVLRDRLRLRGDEAVLEIGAHLGWAAHRLAERAGYVVATDISHQLAIAQGFIDHGPGFDRTFCDMQVLPFGDEVFDLVFGVAVAHHSGDLAGLFARVHAVLKAGGRAVFFAEPVVAVDDEAARASFGLAEKAFGAQEHVYTIDEYFAAAHDAGLQPWVEPLPGILREPGRKWPLARKLWRGLLKTGLGYAPFFTRTLYPRMLRQYPRIPFPRFALVLEKRS
jgi:SAM-dependent methyltransferase